MLLDPAPGSYSVVSPIEAQRPPRYAVGGEGKISFQPEGSSWIFSAAIRYDRSNNAKDVHFQTPIPIPPHGTKIFTGDVDAAPFAETITAHSQSDVIADFNAGKDVGLGLWRGGNTSIVNLGVRFAQFAAHGATNFSGRPIFHASTHLTNFGIKYKRYITFSRYQFSGQSDRRFHGVGPSLSWNASQALAGDKENLEFTLDWGLNAAVLFGRQKASVHHRTTAYHSAGAQHYVTRFRNTPPTAVRSRSVTVPNVGGFAGLSAKFPNAKVSLGYRADLFFGAMDTGIDIANRTNTSFHGPYATISVGLGG
jgi:hypothetical protein